MVKFDTTNKILNNRNCSQRCSRRLATTSRTSSALFTTRELLQISGKITMISRMNSKKTKVKGQIILNIRIYRNQPNLEIGTPLWLLEHSEKIPMPTSAKSTSVNWRKLTLWKKELKTYSLRRISSTVPTGGPIPHFSASSPREKWTKTLAKRTKSRLSATSKG